MRAFISRSSIQSPWRSLVKADGTFRFLLPTAWEHLSVLGENFSLNFISSNPEELAGSGQRHSPADLSTHLPSAGHTSSALLSDGSRNLSLTSSATLRLSLTLSLCWRGRTSYCTTEWEVGPIVLAGKPFGFLTRKAFFPWSWQIHTERAVLGDY